MRLRLPVLKAKGRVITDTALIIFQAEAGTQPVISPPLIRTDPETW